MNLDTKLKIDRAIIWLTAIGAVVGAMVWINSLIVAYRMVKFPESAKEVPLSSLSLNKPDKNWVKFSDYEIDIHKRLRALPDKSSNEDLHILIPLRVPGEQQDAPIRFLFRLDQYSDDAISKAYTAYQDSGILVLEGAAVFAEIVPINDLPGNVPNVIRNNNRVAKDVVVFYSLPIQRSYSHILFGGVLIIPIFVGLIVYVWIRRARKKSISEFS